MITITYPTPITQQKYYLFYSAEASKSINESIETDNGGSFSILFDYSSSVNEIGSINSNIYVNENIIYVESTNDNSSKIFSLSIVNYLGQTLSQFDVQLNNGLNRFSMPKKIANGIYLVILKNDSAKLFFKAVVQN